MKVQIKRSKYQHTWYAGMLGKVVDVERECEEFYWAREPDGRINIIFKCDAEVVE